MLSNINITANSLQITVSGNTPQEILKNILEGMETENLNNLSVSKQRENLIYRDKAYKQTSYLLRLTTPTSPIAIDPDHLS